MEQFVGYLGEPCVKAILSLELKIPENNHKFLDEPLENPNLATNIYKILKIYKINLNSNRFSTNLFRTNKFTK